MIMPTPFWTKSYDEGVEPNLTYPEASLADLFRKGLTAYPDHPAMWYMKREFSFRELWEWVQRFGTFLQHAGLQKGDVVAICLPNCPEYAVAHLATIMAGGASSGLSPLMSAPEMAYQLKDSGARVLVTLDAIYAKHLVKVLDDVPALETIVWANVADSMGLSRVLTFIGKLVKKIPKGKVTPWPGKTVVHFGDVIETTPAELAPPEIDPAVDLAHLYYTGGTTGFPKGVELTHQNLVAELTIIDQWVGFEFGHETFLTGFPFFHAAGTLVFEMAITFAASQVLIANPRDTGHLIKEWIARRPTLVGNVPSLYLMILQDPAAKDVPVEVLDAVRLYVSGAAPFPAELIRRFEREMHAENKVVEVYGMTECSPLITANPVRGKKKIGTVGLPLPDTIIQVLDLETGSPVDPGTPGEIVVKGPQVMPRYWKHPEATSQTIDADGWLHTGDVGVMDPEGYITIVDRVKDMLIVSGFKVYSVHVEEVLTRHDVIDMVAIVGVPDPARPGSEVVKAVVKLAPGTPASDETEQAIQAFAREQLSRYENPKIWEFRDDLPLTAVGKVAKRALRQEQTGEKQVGTVDAVATE